MDDATTQRRHYGKHYDSLMTLWKIRLHDNVVESTTTQGRRCVKHDNSVTTLCKARQLNDNVTKNCVMENTIS